MTWKSCIPNQLYSLYPAFAGGLLVFLEFSLTLRAVVHWTMPAKRTVSLTAFLKSSFDHGFAEMLCLRSPEVRRHIRPTSAPTPT